MIAQYTANKRVQEFLLVIFMIFEATFLSVSKQDTIVPIERQDAFVKQMIPSQLVRVTDFEARAGHLVSPNYPLPHPINSSSLAFLRAYHDPNVDAIRLTFEDLNLQTSNYCESEALEILLAEGLYSLNSDSKASRIYAFCGTFAPRPLTIPSKGVFIHLFSDGFNSGQNRGFKIKFEFLNSAIQIYNGCEQPNHFRCRNRNCIPEHLKCNRHDDCGDASDEDRLTPCDDLPTIHYSIDYLCGLAPLTQQAPLAARRLLMGSTDQDSAESPLSDRIIGGKRTSRRFGWPFQVSIQTMRIEPLAHLCGATLIHPMFVLSAAHCFKGFTTAADYKFVFGSPDLREGTVASGRQQVRYANSISLYPGGVALRGLEELNFRQIDITNDVALIELNAPIEMTAHVWPACLPHLSEPMVVGRECLASGFGDTRGTGFPFRLKQVEQVVEHGSRCQAINRDFNIDDYTMICVRNKLANGPCNGDSGGPLFCADGEDHFAVSMEEHDEELRNNSAARFQPGKVIKYLPFSEDKGQDSRHDKSTQNHTTKGLLRYTVHGVTSFTTDGNLGGSFCGLETVPTIYARVSTKVEWILSKMKMSMFRLSKDDSQQDQNNRSALFGYLFRSGLSRHENFTRPMTIYKL